MIEHVKGNLLTSDCNIIAHQSNCLFGFGSGIAGQIRAMYPAAYEVFMEDTRPPEQKLGTYSFTKKPQGGKYIFNLYGQYNYGKKGPLYTVYPALEQAVKKMLLLIKMTEGHTNFRPKIGMPWKIGCDLAGGDWDGVVLPMLERVSDLMELELWLYEFNPKENK